MAKIRVYEIARKFNVSSSTVMDMLKERGMGNLTASSGLDDNVAEYIERKLKGNAGSQRTETQDRGMSLENGARRETTEERKAVKSVNLEEGRKPEQTAGRPEENAAGKTAAPAGQAKKPEDAAAAPEKKKSRITRVYNPQNMSNPQGRGRGAGRDAGDGRSARPAGERQVGRGQSEGRVFLPDDDRGKGQEFARYRSEDGRRPTGQARPEGERRPTGQARPEGERRPAGQARPEGERRPTGQARPEGERRPAGQARPEGERRPTGQARPEGERRPAGQARPEGERRPAGQVSPETGERPAGQSIREQGSNAATVRQPAAESEKRRPAEQADPREERKQPEALTHREEEQRPAADHASREEKMPGSGADSENRTAQAQSSEEKVPAAGSYVQADKKPSETEDIRENMDTKKEKERIDSMSQIPGEDTGRGRKDSVGNQKENQGREAEESQDGGQSREGNRHSQDSGDRSGRDRDGNRRGQDGGDRSGRDRDGNRRSQDGGDRSGRDRDGSRRGQDGGDRSGRDRDGNRRGQDSGDRSGQNRDGSRRGQDGGDHSGQNRDGSRRGQDGGDRSGQNRDGSRRGQDGGDRSGQNRDGSRRGQDGGDRSGQNRDGNRGDRFGQGRDQSRQGRDGRDRDGAGRDAGRGGQGGFRRDGGAGRDSGFNRDSAGQGGDRSGFNRRSQDGQGTGGTGRTYRDGAGRDNGNGRSYGGGRDAAGRDAGRGGQGGFRRDGGAGRDGGFNRDSAGQGGDRSGFNRRGQDAGRRRPGDSAMRGEGFKEDAAFRQGKNDRKNRQERNKQDNRERSFHQEKAIKTPVKQQAKPKEAPEEKIKLLVLPDTISVKELADKMSVQPSALLKKLLLAGTIVNLNQEIDYEMAEQIALEYDIICEREEKVDVIAELLKEDEEDESLMQKRPPVVCVMGHVDHGKTSLLDAIRKTNVIAHEAGGITQHIGAYTVEIDGRQITFLDTPGHEAFTAMRMRGAQATDIAILVVAADDGVMPQTVEAINHAKAAGISIIVAINKIDKPGANVERVKQELTEHGLVAESWGGSTIMVPVSAHTGEGIEELLEMVLLDADINELKANPDRKARGIVIEAKLDKGRGPVMTVLVQKGTLHVGENVAVGEHYGKVRSMINDKGRRVDSAGPSVPVEIAGMNGVPNAGEIFIAMDNEKDARTFAETFIAEGKKKLIEGTKAKMSLDDLYSQIKAGDVKELDIVVKADVQGSVEAVRQSLEKLSNDEVIVKVIHGGVGAINESDVTLASASNAIVIGFNVKPDNQAKDIAQTEHVDMRLYSVIYNAIADVELAMKGMLDPIFEEKVIGHGEVRQTFKASGVGTIAGTYVLDGIIRRGCKCRITRGGDQIFDGELASLKRFKDDAKEVRAGYECGCVFEKFNDLQEGDQIEAYDMVEVPRI